MFYWIHLPPRHATPRHAITDINETERPRDLWIAERLFTRAITSSFDCCCRMRDRITERTARTPSIRYPQRVVPLKLRARHDGMMMLKCHICSDMRCCRETRDMHTVSDVGFVGSFSWWRARPNCSSGARIYRWFNSSSLHRRHNKARAWSREMVVVPPRTRCHVCVCVCATMLVDDDGLSGCWLYARGNSSIMLYKYMMLWDVPECALPC